jgi:hypothetical protein
MTNYNPFPRGKCAICRDYVWSDQGRNKDASMVYRHNKCPRRMGGTLEELEMLDRDLIRRANNYEQITHPNHPEDHHLLTGFKLYLRLPKPRAPMGDYSNERGDTFTWILSKLYNDL